ncbi:unnamed protein product [Schistosoma rodhaini]|nr:unnamed protein product [Schistosoma rodhaini]
MGVFQFLLPTLISNITKATKTTGGGRFLTELGLCRDDGNPSSVNTLECKAVLDEADKHFESWTYWDGYFIDDAGNPNQNQVQSFIRPYPQSTNGRFLKQHFNHKTGEYSFSFITNQTRNQYSEKQNLIAEIYIPLSVHYPNGYSINLNPNNLTTEMKGNTLSIYLPTDLRNEHVLVEMKMVRK